MLVHLLGTLFRILLNAPHTVNLFSDVIQNIFTSRSASTSSALEVVTFNALYKLLTYLLIYVAR